MSEREEPGGRSPLAAAPGPAKLYGPEFAHDPGAVYDRLRREYGELAPVELAPGAEATLVIGYDAALEVMRDPGRFPRGGREWHATLPPDSPVLPVLGDRPTTLSANGTVHARLRTAITDSLARIDSFALRGYVERSADRLIDAFAGKGEADLVADYAKPLPILVSNELFGCPAEIGDRISRGTRGMLDASAPGAMPAEEANAMFAEATRDLVALKRAQPGPDVTSWLIGHPAGLDDEELAEQLGMLLAIGVEPELNLIANGLWLLLSDDRFGGDLAGGSLPVEDALDEILWTDPPLANFGTTYPRHEVNFRGHRLPAHRPVVISYAAATTDPSRASADRAGNRAHLAFAAGPHGCPAKGPARVIASLAIERLLDRLPDLEPAVRGDELRWRPGPFHRALVELPVTFPVEEER
ncbi:cytochrome P450 [Actinomadura algeriensis]|uniref:Cytochrome P450 n=1 Tax=Actinomadura algeriensis TaxID=1679523 RepID=A0ABR9JK41_9ACTN|nr:cytochrome P450 [Actinomadura algeriensis]MBE1530916.1 cytochrome P450 [Actinomadura algeriensis]